MKKLSILSILFVHACSYRRGELIPQIDGFYGFHIPVFALFLTASALASYWLIQRAGKAYGWPKASADAFLIVAIVVGIVGGKLFYVLETYETWWPSGNLVELLLSPGGLTWYGGFILAVIGFFIVAKFFNIPATNMLDALTAPTAVGYAIGRLGCAASGDGCYGTQCTLNLPAPFCMSFPNGIANWGDVLRQFNDPNLTVYNTPLFEAIFAVTSLLILLKLVSKPRGDGRLFFWFVLFHSAFRYSIEYIRLNPKNVLGFSQAQAVSLSIMALVSCLLAFIYYKKRKGSRK